MPKHFQLRELVIAYVRQVGTQNAADFFGEKYNTVQRWKERPTAQIPIEAAQKVMDKLYNAEARAVQSEAAKGKNVMAMLPLRDVVTETSYCLSQLKEAWGKRMHINFSHSPQTPATMNWQAQRFLESDCEWSFWFSAQSVFSWGDKSAFNSIFAGADSHDQTEVDIITRLTSHGLDLVGATHGDYADKVVESTQIFTRTFVAHRSVFEAILREIPETQSANPDEPPLFFTPTYANCDEVNAFWVRAKASGIKPHLDYGCQIGKVNQHQIDWKS